MLGFLAFLLAVVLSSFLVRLQKKKRQIYLLLLYSRQELKEDHKKRFAIALAKPVNGGQN